MCSFRTALAIRSLKAIVGTAAKGTGAAPSTAKVSSGIVPDLAFQAERWFESGT